MVCFSYNQVREKRKTNSPETFVVAALEKEAPLGAVVGILGADVDLELAQIAHEIQALVDSDQEVLNHAGGQDESPQKGLPIILLVELDQG